MAENISRLTLIFLMPVLIAGQSAPSSVVGTINGKPISDSAFNVPRKLATDLFILNHQREPNGTIDDQEINSKIKAMECDRLKGAIMSAAHDAVKQQSGVVASQQDLQAAREAYPILKSSNPHDRAAVLLSALSAVYDQHQDPGLVYEQKLRGQIPLNLWQMYVHDARTPDGRQDLEKMFSKHLTITPDVIAKSDSSLETWRRTAESMKLDETVDQLIAARDPVFRSYLEEYKKKVRREGNRVRAVNFSLDHQRYLDQKRSEFWKSEVSKLDVYLSDLSLGTSCNLASIGVRLANQ